MTSFSDDFNRADGAPGANWVLVSGPWTIISQQLSAGTAGGTVVIRAATAMDTSDHSAQVTIAATTSASQGVWCRGDSTLSQGYLWRNNGSAWALFSVVAGVFTSIGTYSAAAVAGDVAKIQAVGSTIKGYVGGVERVSVVNTAVTTGTGTGVRADSTGGLKFDDFVAADVVAGATLGIASSTETAQPLTGTKTPTLAIAAEVGSAQPIVGAKAGTLAFAGATESAQPLAGSKTASLGIATEVGSAQAVASAKGATLAPAVEQDAAQALGGVKAGTLGIAGSVEVAQPLTPTVHATLQAAEAVETALPLVGAKSATLTPALEIDAARPLTVPSTNVPSPERTYMIPAENRRLTVAAEHRTLTVRR